MTIEKFVEMSAACRSLAELDRLFTRAVAEAGYQNVSFVRFDTKGYLSIPILQAPDAFLDVYVEQHCVQADAVLVEALKSRRPFYWNDIPRRRELTGGEHNTFEVCREIGVHSGLSIPYHGPDGVVDLIGLSLRDERRADTSAAAVGRLTALTSIMRWRYWEIRNDLETRAAPTTVHHADGPPGMTDAHCHALVLIAIADRRRQIGLRHLSLEIGRHVADADLAYLLSWGYVHDRPDDGNFRFELAPTPLGRQHLATCENAQRHRRAAFELQVPRGERARFRDE